MSIGTQGGTYFNGLTSAFLGYLATTVNDVTGNSTAYTLGTTTALTEVFDQNSDFDGMTYTAPVSGICIFTVSALITGTTLAAGFTARPTTSNRQYSNSIVRNGESTNMSTRCQCLADMDAADTATGVVIVGGQAAATADVAGGSNAFTSFSGCLVG